MDTVMDGKISDITASDMVDGIYVSLENTVKYITADDVQSAQFVGSLLHVCEIDGRAVLCFPGNASSVDFQ